MNEQTRDVLVSIAIPAYKPNYLAEAIESALNQDYHDIELVIVNDCSPYDLDSIVRKYDDIRIRYYINGKNLGKKSIVHNWNRCLEYARGEYFVLLCDDDILKPNFVSRLLSLAKQYPSCNVFHARRLIWDIRSDNTTIEPQWEEFETSDDFSKQTFTKTRTHTISEFLYRTDHIRNIKYQVFPVGYFSDDVSLILFAEEGGVVSSREPLMRFRVSDDHISTNPRYSIGKAKAHKKYVSWVSESPKYSIYRDYAIGVFEQDSIYYLYGAQGWDKIRILPYISHDKRTRKLICDHFVGLWKKKIINPLLRICK